MYAAHVQGSILTCFESLESQVKSKDASVAATAFCVLIELICGASASLDLGSLKTPLMRSGRVLQTFSADLVGRIRALPTVLKIRCLTCLRQLVLLPGNDTDLPKSQILEHLIDSLAWGLQFGEEPVGAVCCKELAILARQTDPTTPLAIAPQLLQLALQRCLTTIDCSGFGLEEACLNMAALLSLLSGELLRAGATHILQQCETQADPRIRRALLSHVWLPLLTEDCKLLELHFQSMLGQANALIQAGELPPIQSASLLGACLVGFTQQAASPGLRALANLAPPRAAADPSMRSVTHIVRTPKGAMSFPFELVLCFMEAFKGMCTAAWTRLSGTFKNSTDPPPGTSHP